MKKLKTGSFSCLIMCFYVFVLNYYVNSLFAGCLQNEYRCMNKCIELVKRCDKITDCDEGEDEIDCSKLIFI